MDLLAIAVIAGAWLVLLTFAVALCKVAARADAEQELGYLSLLHGDSTRPGRPSAASDAGL